MVVYMTISILNLNMCYLVTVVSHWLPNAGENQKLLTLHHGCCNTYTLASDYHINKQGSCTRSAEHFHPFIHTVYTQFLSHYGHI